MRSLLPARSPAKYQRRQVLEGKHGRRLSPNMVPLARERAGGGAEARYTGHSPCPCGYEPERKALT